MKISAGLMTGAALLASLTAAAAEDAPDTGVDVDLEAYGGLWYEIARTPAPYEQPCRGGVTATYEITGEDTLSVLNRCDTGDGMTMAIEGTATVLNASGNALHVDFAGTPSQEGANYVIEGVGTLIGNTYAWAVVNGGDGDTAWILARSPIVDDDTLGLARAVARDAGFDTDRFSMTPQPPESYDPSGG